MFEKQLVVNGIPRSLVVEGDETLADMLRKLGCTSVKIGCGTGQCGACNVIIDGKLVRTCTMKMKRVADGARITTLEGIGTPGHLHPLQKAWIMQ